MTLAVGHLELTKLTCRNPSVKKHRPPHSSFTRLDDGDHGRRPKSGFQSQLSYKLLPDMRLNPRQCLLLGASSSPFICFADTVCPPPKCTGDGHWGTGALGHWGTGALGTGNENKTGEMSKRVNPRRQSFLPEHGSPSFLRRHSHSTEPRPSVKAVTRELCFVTECRLRQRHGVGIKIVVLTDQTTHSVDRY